VSGGDETDDALGATARASPDDLPSSSARVRIRHAIPAGTRVDRYVIGRQLGAGGMGAVYAAHDPQLDRGVAIKLLHPHLADRQARLLAEGQAVAKLRHPNVVVIHDVGTHDDGLFIAMELVEGPTLFGWLQTPRPWRDVIAMFIQAGRGLVAAHAAGLVHRDFKPDNVPSMATGARW
jgi:serine/threonine protein kinase